MSTTIGDLVDRVYREYLEPMDDVVSYSYLTSGINDSTTTIPYDGDLFSVEEEDALDAGAIIEIGQELMFAKELNTVTNEITVQRGARGTTAVSHSLGDIIKIAPPYPRKNVFDAVKDQIENLYPTLFAVEVQTITSSTGYTVLTGGDDNYLVAPLKAISQYTDWSAGSDETTTQYRGVSVELIDLPNPFTYTDSEGSEQTVTYTSGPSVVKALQMYGIASGHTVYVTFKKKFVEITNEATTLSSVGLQNEYEAIIMAGVAAHIMSGRDIPSATADYITDQMSIQNFPVNSGTSIRNSLLRYQQVLINQARKDLRARYPEPVSINSIVYPAQ